MTISEKAAYVKGLVEGLSIAADSAEGKAINALCDLCADLASELQRQSVRAGALEQGLEEVNDYVDAIDSDLFTVEKMLDIDDDLDDFIDYDDGDDEDIYQTTCPECGSDCFFTEDDIREDDSVICPVCGAAIGDLGFGADPEDDEED